MRRYILLAEMHRVQNLLLENRIDFLRQKYLEKINQTLPKVSVPQDFRSTIVDRNGRVSADKVFDLVATHDPDPVKKNTQWLLNLFVAGRLPFEDLEKATDYLTRYAEKKKRKQLAPEHADLNRFKSLGDLFAAINDAETKFVDANDAEKRKAFSEANILLDSPRYTILNPKTKFAAMFFGRDTEWCTAWGDPSGRYPTRACRFDDYHKDGPLYVIIDKTSGHKWQFHFESGQLMDENDRRINVQEFINSHPEVVKFFHDREVQDTEIVGEVGGYIAYRSPGMIKFLRAGDAITPGLMGIRRNIARIMFDDHGFITSVVNIDLVGRGNANFPFQVYYNGKQLISFLETAGLKSVEPVFQGSMEFDVFYDPKTSTWGSLREIGKPISMGLSGGGQWQEVVCKNGDTYAVYSQQGETLIRLAVEKNGKHPEVTTSDILTKDKDARELALKHVAAYLIHKKDITGFGEDSKISPRDFDTETSMALIEDRPDLADLSMLFKVKGPSDPNVRDKLFAALRGGINEAEITHTQTFVGDDVLVLEEYKDWVDLVENNGNQYVDLFISLMQGDSSLDYSGNPVEDHHRLELLNGLASDDLAKIGAYMQEHYANDIDEEFEDEAFDPTSVDDVLRLQNIVDDESLSSAFASAVYAGYETGGENQAHEIMMKEFRKNPYIYFYDEKDNTYSTEFSFDAKCVVAAPVKEIVDNVSSEESRTVWADYGKWLPFVERVISPVEPYYGFDKYDSDAAKEQFAEYIHEFIV